MIRTYLTTAALVFTLGTAHADPCAMVDKDQATWAVKHITASPNIVRWCVSCGETTPGTPVKPQDVKAVANKTAAWQVLVAGRGVDLANIYVQTGPKTFANVGGLVGCSVSAPFTDLSAAAPPSSCPPPPLPGTCAQGKPAPVRDAVTGCIRSYLCPPR